MTTYPTGAFVNKATPGAPVKPGPINKDHWDEFSSQADADEAFEWIKAVCIPDACVMDVSTGLHSQYIYIDPHSDVRCRTLVGMAMSENGVKRALWDYPSVIFDANTTPRAFIDKYSPGQPHTLKVADGTLGTPWGQLYWAAD